MTEVDKNSADIFATDPELRQCFQWIHAKRYDEAQKKLEAKIKIAQTQKDKDAEGIVLSILGMLFKVRRDVKMAYKYYQQAEKCLPDDMSLKMINARLLVEEFHQSETALRKLEKILQATAHDPVMQHHALALKALAYLQMGKKPEAKAVFTEVVLQDFTKLRSAVNVDYKTCETFLRKDFEVDLCLQYLQRCMDLAVQLKEKQMIQVLTQLKAVFAKSKESKPESGF